MIRNSEDPGAMGGIRGGMTDGRDWRMISWNDAEGDREGRSQFTLASGREKSGGSG